MPAQHFTVSVTFDRPFVSAPDVFVTSDEIVFLCSAREITTTGFKYRILNVGTEANVDVRYPKWVAVGELA